jgi:hypothetical protein
VPSSGNRISLGTPPGSSMATPSCGRAASGCANANTAQGTPVVFAGGRLTFASDDDMKTFADNLLATLKAVRAHVGDMYLGGGDMKGIERLAASWAEQNGIQQVRFGLDRKLGDRAGFRRNEQMLSVKPRFVIAFQGNGVTERLVIEAKARVMSSIAADHSERRRRLIARLTAGRPLRRPAFLRLANSGGGGGADAPCSLRRFRIMFMPDRASACAPAFRAAHGRHWKAKLRPYGRQAAMWTKPMALACGICATRPVPPGSAS